MKARYKMSAELIESKNTQEAEYKPSIYIACLAAYNSGHLHGKWVEPADTVEGLQEQINQVLKSSPVEDAEEWAIHDYDNFYNLGEYPNLEDVVKLAAAYKEHGQDMVDDWMEYHCESGLEHLESIEDDYHGQWDSFKDFAYQLAEDTIPELNDDNILSRYFDYDSFANDLEHDYHMGGNGHIWGMY